LWKSLDRGMSTDCGEQKLRGLYQDLLLPAIAARDIRRITDFRTLRLPFGGTDGMDDRIARSREIQEL
jgi:hypothetical protein